MKSGLRLIGLLLIGSSFSCRPRATESHESGALTEQNPVCYNYSQAQYDALNAQLKGLPFFHNFTTEQENKDLLKHFHAVPKVYRDLMINQSRSGAFQGFFKEKIESSGVCSYGPNGCAIIRLSNTQQNVIQFSMIHEIGHGMKAQALRKFGQNSQAFDARIQEFLEEGQAHNNSGKATNRLLRIRAYSFKSVNEFWADSFHNYYCSPESHDFIKKYLPKNYAFLQQILDKPVWAQPEVKDPAPPENGADPRAGEHISSLFSLYNDSVKSCSLSLGSMTAPNAAGEFEVMVKALKKGTTQSAGPDFALKSSIGKQLARELSELRRNMPGYVPGCPKE